MNNYCIPDSRVRFSRLQFYFLIRRLTSDLTQPHFQWLTTTCYSQVFVMFLHTRQCVSALLLMLFRPIYILTLVFVSVCLCSSFQGVVFISRMLLPMRISPVRVNLPPNQDVHLYSHIYIYHVTLPKFFLIKKKISLHLSPFTDFY